MTRALVVAALLGSTALAQPKPDDSGGRVDAKSLLQSGVRLLEAKDYLGALAVFRDAYARFPSAKILLNIGTTQNLLDRKADAGNTYQRYLSSPEADPAKTADVLAALAEIDKRVGRLELTVTPDDAEVKVNDSEWQPAARATVVRVDAGPFTVRVRKEAFGPEEKTAQIAAGDRAVIAIALTALPVAPVETRAVVSDEPDVLLPEEPRSRFAGLMKLHLDIPREGGAGLIGATYDVTDRVEVNAAAILGPFYGAYAGASFALLGGSARPYLAAGIPVFFSEGVRVGGRVALGVELRVSKKFSLLAELGGEMMLNPEDTILRGAFIPAIGATGRM